MRTCCGCRESFPKKELIRVVRTPEGTVEIDLTGRKNGRGAYLCRNTDCLRRAKKSGAFARSLGAPVTEEICAVLEKELEAIET